MIHNIIYEAVRKKAQTTPPNEYIGNVEMAAAIGIILKDKRLAMDFTKIETPEEIKEKFLSMVPRDTVEGENLIMYDRIVKYKVKKMVNENMEDLEILIKNEERL